MTDISHKNMVYYIIHASFTHNQDMVWNTITVYLPFPSRRESLGSTGARSVVAHGPVETAGRGWAKSA